MSNAESVSPTAHYTSQVWLRNGLSHPALGTREGRLMFLALEPSMRASRLVGGPSLEPYLLARHRTIDALLEQAITERGVAQVVEVACGMSPRGWRFAQRYGADLDYVEADLPAMAERKRRALARAGSLGEHHRVVALDVVREGGAGSLEELLDGLEPERGVAVITEGLLGYLDTPTVEALWRRLAAALRRFPSGSHFADILPGTAGSNPLVVAGRRTLGAFVRGQVHLHHADAGAVAAALRDCGFTTARLVRPRDLLAVRPARESLAHLVDASVLTE